MRWITPVAMGLVCLIAHAEARGPDGEPYYPDQFQAVDYKLWNTMGGFCDMHGNEVTGPGRIGLAVEVWANFNGWHLEGVKTPAGQVLLPLRKHPYRVKLRVTRGGEPYGCFSEPWTIHPVPEEILEMAERERVRQAP